MIMVSSNNPAMLSGATCFNLKVLFTPLRTLASSIYSWFLFVANPCKRIVMEKSHCSFSPNVAEEVGGSGKWRRWSKQEDDRLIKYIQTHGARGWRNIPTAIGLHRSAASCHGRWMNHLRPNINHNKITEEEKQKIIKIHNAVGTRWSIMAKYLPNRSACHIRNYWRSTITKKYGNGEIDLNKPEVLNRENGEVLKIEEVNKAGGTCRKQMNMNIDQELDLELRIGPDLDEDLDLELRIGPPAQHGTGN